LSQEEKIKLKQELKEICTHLLEERIQTASDAMKQAQESANNAEKNSAGDKYETARAMGQLDRDMNAKQFEEGKREFTMLQSIDSGKLYDHVTNGAFVICKKNMFFVATGLGSITHKGKTIILLSPKAPLSIAMIQKKAGDSFTFNGTNFEIKEVF
jgi:transcription elongation GreA/GreB family factor